MYEKTLRQNRVGSMIYFLIGGLYLLYSLIPIMEGQWQLATYTLVFGVAMVISGAWMARVSKHNA